jgi:hypothetical protein
MLNFMPQLGYIGLGCNSLAQRASSIASAWSRGSLVDTGSGQAI